MKRILLVLLLIFVVGITAACQKEDTPEQEVTTTRNELMQDAYFLNVFNETLKVDSVFDAREGIMAFDGDGVDLTSKFRVTGGVNTTEPGTYELVYTVKGFNGNDVETTRLITVVTDVPTAEISGFAFGEKALADATEAELIAAEEATFDVEITDNGTITYLEVVIEELVNGKAQVEPVLTTYHLPNDDIDTVLASLEDIPFEGEFADDSISYKIKVIANYIQNADTLEALVQEGVVLATYTYEYAAPAATISNVELNEAEDEVTYDVVISEADLAKLTSAKVSINGVETALDLEDLEDLTFAVVDDTFYYVEVLGTYGNVADVVIGTYVYPEEPTATISELTINETNDSADFTITLPAGVTDGKVTITEYTLNEANHPFEIDSYEELVIVDGESVTESFTFAGDFDNEDIYYVIEVTADYYGNDDATLAELEYIYVAPAAEAE